MNLIKANIIQYAKELGFQDVGFSKADALTGEEKHLNDWLSAGYHGTMGYLARNQDLRLDPTLLHPGTKTIISLTFNYFPSSAQKPGIPKIARYAFGRDYHKVLKKKMKLLTQWMHTHIDPHLNIRYFTDSAPILERQWAHRAGLGWIGRNTLLIHPKKGSYFFIADLLVDLDLPPDQPIPDYCGTCRRCVDACPTGAILEEGYVMDGSKCISYATIENHDATFPLPVMGKTEGWVFGCDICQEVCPWNRFSIPHEAEEFMPTLDRLQLTAEDWRDMTPERFESLFQGTPVKRAGLESMQRNVAAAFPNNIS